MTGYSENSVSDIKTPGRNYLNIEAQLNYTEKLLEDLQREHLELQATIVSFKEKVSPQC